MKSQEKSFSDGIYRWNESFDETLGIKPGYWWRFQNEEAWILYLKDESLTEDRKFYARVDGCPHRFCWDHHKTTDWQSKVKKHLETCDG